MYTTHIWQVSLAGQAGVVTGRKMLENIDEFVQERLALYTHEEVFEVIIVETAGPAAVAPKLHRGHVHIFFSHTVLDSSQAKCARARHPEKIRPACDPDRTEASKKQRSFAYADRNSP